VTIVNGTFQPAEIKLIRHCNVVLGIDEASATVIRMMQAGKKKRD
jgi:hypothetical protein